MNIEERDKKTNDTILKDYLEWIELNDVVCPFPMPWSDIFNVIIDLTKINNNHLIDLIGRPCIMNSWDNPEEIKLDRFINHLKFAHEKKILFWVDRKINEHQEYLDYNPEKMNYSGAFLQKEFPKNTKKKSRREWQQGVMKPNNYYRMTNPFPPGSRYNKD